MTKLHWTNIAIFSAFVLALVLCCALGVNYSPISVPEATPDRSEMPIDTSTPDIKPTTTPVVSPTSNQGVNHVPTSIAINGNTIATLFSRQAAEGVVEEAIEILSSIDGSSQFEVELLCVIEYSDAPASAPHMSSDDALMVLTSPNTPLRVKSTVHYSTTERILSRIITQTDNTLRNGMRIVKEYGSDGIKVSTFESIYINGMQQSTAMLSDDIIIEAVDTYVLVGTAISNEISPGEDEGTPGPEITGMTFMRPTAGNIVFNFGNYIDGFHMGLDFSGNVGDDVYASCAGTVVSASVRGGLGLMIEIDHGNGVTTRYAHLHEITVNIGDTVTAGSLIGFLGESGNCDAPHLHFELRIDGYAYNPRFYIDL